MLLMYLAGQGPVLDVTVTTSGSHFTAYAIDYQADHSLSVVLDNKDPSTGIQATIELGPPVANASAIYLTGAEPGSLTTESVRLAGAGVSAAGDWPRQPPYVQATTGTTVSIS
jgi:hypothetical protein